MFSITPLLLKQFTATPDSSDATDGLFSHHFASSLPSTGSDSPKWFWLVVRKISDFLHSVVSPTKGTCKVCLVFVGSNPSHNIRRCRKSSTDAPIGTIEVPLAFYNSAADI